MNAAADVRSDRVPIAMGRTFAVVAVGLAVTSMAIVVSLNGAGLLIQTRALSFGMYAVGLGVLTWVMVSAQPRNGAVWAIAWTSIFAALLAAGAALVSFGTRDVFPGLTYDTLRELSPSQLPFPAAVGFQTIAWAIVPAFWLPLTLGLLLFPDGHPPTARWKWVGWWSVLAIAVATLATALVANPNSTLPIKAFEDGIDDNTISGISDIAFLLAMISAFVAIASIIVRYRRSDTTTRSQIRWIGLGATLYFIALAFGPDITPSEPQIGYELALLGIQSLLFVTYGVAIMRYRLYDIDVVISRSLTYGVLAVFITGMYALVVVGVGSVVGGGGDPSLVLSIVAVTLVAVAFEPLRNRVQRWANRLVFGERATPYEVLSQTTARLGRTRNPEDALLEVTRLVADGTGAIKTVMWIKVGEELHPVVGTPSSVIDTLEPVPIPDEEALDGFAGDLTVAVHHRDELLGALSITKPRGQSATAADEKILTDVAAGSGLLLRNIGLNTALAERAVQLRNSRRRLVAAQDTERHRLERNLHDGAQQQIVALKVKLGIATTLAEREDAHDVASLLTSLATDTQTVVDAMRAVAHGIYPSLLESDGLPAALGALSRTASVPVSIVTDDLDRYERTVEEAIYFSVLDTVTRAIDAGATTINVTITAQTHRLEFTITHNGSPTDTTSIEDRLDAHGGHLNTTATRTTIVTGYLPTTTDDTQVQAHEHGVRHVNSPKPLPESVPEKVPT